MSTIRVIENRIFIKNKAGNDAFMITFHDNRIVVSSTSIQFDGLEVEMVEPMHIYLRARERT